MFPTVVSASSGISQWKPLSVKRRICGQSEAFIYVQPALKSPSSTMFCRESVITSINSCFTKCILCTPPLCAQIHQIILYFSLGICRLKLSIHIGAPASADISHHIIESIHFLHSVFWRGVLGDQNKVLHS